MNQLDLFDASPPSPAPRAPAGKHLYRKAGDVRVCKRCGVLRRDAPTGRRGGFFGEWQTKVNGQDVWTRDCPPCVRKA